MEKERGNELYKGGQYRSASDAYEICLRGLQATIVDRPLEAVLYTNKSAAHTKLQEWALALASAEQALSIGSLTGQQKKKAMFRKDKALEMVRLGGGHAVVEN